MRTKVALGVALLLIEFSNITLSFNMSLSSDNDTTIEYITSFLNISNYTTTESTEISFTQSSSTVPTTSSVEPLIEFQLPENCSSYKLLKDQPKATQSSSIKKCCPLHQNYKYDYGKRSCANSTSPFKLNAIQAKFYENCIEDEEVNVTISIVIENNCKNGLIYNENYNDILYVIQNGSLLRIDDDYESFDIYDHYCLEFDEDEGVLTAIVCEFDDLLLKVGRAQALIFATCMFISVPCLLITAALYLIVPELRDLHGKSLACHSISLSSGFFLLAFTQFRDMNTFEGYFIQFCIIACFFWLTVMWIDICIHAWYYLPRGIKQTPKDDNVHLMYYALFAFGVPLILVILTYKNKLSGLPSYYIKGTTKVARTSQTFFIPPITVTLILNLCLYVLSYFGFHKLQKKINIMTFLTLKLKKCATENKCSAARIAHIEKVETIMKSTAFLTIIMTINWIFEIISFYNETSSTLFDIINALQGVLIFLMFVCLPRPLKLIGQWWNDRGSFQVLDNNFEKQTSDDIQMTTLCKQ
ncbi:CLUMA_CG003206, isoform A [Clunio marinus]|uniref:CLUMA_CG003206, isoform A n=1 Tax=Clunio marinus TaxID=568069 RepID=A0A1J1HND7_9DIPT|nr:CLUMA_CG003206, isoform A [Clunio marinus]